MGRLYKDAYLHSTTEPQLPMLPFRIVCRVSGLISAVQCLRVQIGSSHSKTHHLFIPMLTHREVNDLERDLLSLPARLGGMGITKPTEENKIANTNSLFVSEPLLRLVMHQEFEFEPTDILRDVKELRKVVDRESDKRNLEKKLDTILESKLATPELKLAIKACKEQGF